MSNRAERNTNTVDMCDSCGLHFNVLYKILDGWFCGACARKKGHIVREEEE